jgi:cell division protein FtsA
VAVFADGRPKHLAVIPVGGDHITNDIASVLKIPINKAEEIKKEVDIFSPEQADLMEKLEFDHMGRNYSYSLSELTEIVQCRIEELFTMLVKKEIEASGVSMLPAGLVITGGGSRSIGIDQYLSRVMDMPVRTAPPIDSNRMPPGRNGPEYTCASGIIKYALEQELDPHRYMEQSLDILRLQGRGAGPQASPRGIDNLPPPRRGGSIIKTIKTIKDVIKELF